MINYSTCKINLGLSVIARRADGFREIESVLYPVGGSLCDMVEMIRSESGFRFTSSGIAVDCEERQNLCVRAYNLMRSEFGIGDVCLHLHKRIPFGAGLGAGSANATTVIGLANSLFDLQLSDQAMENLAAQIGSDAPFFVRNRPAIARSRGEILSAAEVDLSGYYLLLIKPDVGVSTAEAYSLVTPRRPAILPSQAIAYPIEQWARVLCNDFEEAIFERLPMLSIIRGELYRAGAIYAAMSGSGSTIFGLFRDYPSVHFAHFTYITRL